MQNVKGVILAIFVLTVSGCAFIPQQVNLRPNPILIPSDIGNNSSVYINVLDERTNKALGRRGATYNSGAYGPAAEITSKEELSVVVNREIENGLEIQGFTISDRVSADNILTVEIRGLEYSTSLGFLTEGIHIIGTFKGRAKNKNSEMEKMYRYEKEARVQSTPTAVTNEKLINQALSGTLSKLLNDPELLEFLSRQP